LRNRWEAWPGSSAAVRPEVRAGIRGAVQDHQLDSGLRDAWKVLQPYVRTNWETTLANSVRENPDTRLFVGIYPPLHERDRLGAAFGVQLDLPDINAYVSVDSDDFLLPIIQSWRTAGYPALAIIPLAGPETYLDLDQALLTLAAAGCRTLLVAPDRQFLEEL